MAADQESLPDGKLPGDVMVSILINLHVKSLIKFQLVNKSWYFFISSTHFFNLHLHHHQSVIAPNNCLLSLRDYDYDSDDEDEDRNDNLDLDFGLLDFTHYYDSHAAVDNNVSMLVDGVPPSHLTLRDSCNGLVCLAGNFQTSCDVILWNPATRRYRCLDVPEGDDDLDFFSLGLCYVDDDFKILVWNYIYPAPFNTVDTPYLYVYSLSSDSWDKFDFYAPGTKVEFKSPVFMGRSMHWLSHRRGSAPEIVVFDVMSKAKSCFNLPGSCGRHYLANQQALVIGGCLSVVIYFDTDVDAHETGIGVWVMEQYGVEESWVRRYFVKGDFTQVKFPLVAWTDGEIVLYDEGDDSKVLVFVDLYSGNKRYVEFSAYHVLKFFKYVESLAPVEPDEPDEDEFDSSGEEGVDSSSEEGDSNDSG